MDEIFLILCIQCVMGIKNQNQSTHLIVWVFLCSFVTDDMLRACLSTLIYIYGSPEHLVTLESPHIERFERPTQQFS